MIKKISTKLIEGFDTESSPFLYRRLIMTSALLFITLIAFLAFVFINYSIGKYHIAAIDVFIILVTSFALYILFVKKNIELAAGISTSMLFTFLVFFSYVNKNHNFGLVWTLCYPLFVIPILGGNKGLIWIGLFYAILIPMTYLGIGEWDNGYWNKTAFLRFFMASLTIVYTAYFFESSSVAAYNTVLESREKEQQYLSTLENLSITDQLTGLYNRRYFDDHFEMERQKVQRYNSLLCLIMIDIDHFKLINDKFGHQCGDLVLKKFSQLLKKNIRSTDILSRWGGEEFLILLPATSLENALKMAEKMRKAIEQNTFAEVGEITASFGVSEVTASSNSDREAIYQADKALYHAKNKGRNKVISYEKLPTGEKS